MWRRRKSLQSYHRYVHLTEPVSRDPLQAMSNIESDLSKKKEARAKRCVCRGRLRVAV